MSGVMIFDIILKFFQAYRVNQNAIDESEDDEDELQVKASAKVSAQTEDEENEEDSLTTKQKQQRALNERAALILRKKEEKRLKKRRKEIDRMNAKWYDPEYEKRCTKIAGKYLGTFFIGYFLFDSLACVPVFLYEASHGFTTSEAEKDEQIASNVYQILCAFKVFKLLMLSRINKSLNLI